VPLGAVCVSCGRLPGVGALGNRRARAVGVAIEPEGQSIDRSGSRRDEPSGSGGPDRGGTRSSPASSRAHGCSLVRGAVVAPWPAARPAPAGDAGVRSELLARSDPTAPSLSRRTNLRPAVHALRYGGLMIFPAGEPTACRWRHASSPVAQSCRGGWRRASRQLGSWALPVGVHALRLTRLGCNGDPLDPGEESICRKCSS
jgi:hypothetical protein